MSSKIIFYSWQSDLDKKTNNHFIKGCIEKSLKKLNREIEFELSLDKDTQNNSGSPDIVDTIMRKIRAADIFICDVTIINNDWYHRLFKLRKTPNPNVMIELGYAVKCLGWDRVICVANLTHCDLEDLPFDIRNNRIATYSTDGASKKENEEILTDTITKAVKSILDHYDQIVENFHKDEHLDHDKNLFALFNEMASQIKLFDSLDFLTGNLRTNDAFYRLWDNINDFYQDLGNHFLNKEIQDSFKKLAGDVDKLRLFVSEKLFAEQIPGQKYTQDYEEAGVVITPELQMEIDQTHRYRYPEGPSDNDWDTYHKRKYGVQDEFIKRSHEIKEAYTQFRLLVKKHLLI
jgi:hypothetical protein